jgi:hypothetical protein
MLQNELVVSAVRFFGVFFFWALAGCSLFLLGLLLAGAGGGLVAFRAPLGEELCGEKTVGGKGGSSDPAWSWWSWAAGMAGSDTQGQTEWCSCVVV